MSESPETRTDGAGGAAASDGRAPTEQRSRRRRFRAGSWLLRAGIGGVFAFLLAPVVVVAITSIGESAVLSVPPSGFSLRWYEAFARSERWQEATVNSLIAGIGTTVVATGIGTAAALGVSNLGRRSEAAVTGLTVLPLLVPGVVLGSSLLVLLGEFGFQQTYPAVIAAHSLWATPLAFSVVRASLSRFDPQLREAALDLGASPARAFLEVVAPNIRSGLLAAALIAFIVSLQEFVMTLFVAGPNTRTVPVLAWTSVRDSLDPLISVVSTLFVAVVVLVTLVGAVTIGLERLATET